MDASTMAGSDIVRDSVSGHQDARPPPTGSDNNSNGTGGPRGDDGASASDDLTSAALARSIGRVYAMMARAAEFDNGSADAMLRTIQHEKTDRTKTAKAEVDAGSSSGGGGGGSEASMINRWMLRFNSASLEAAFVSSALFSMFRSVMYARVFTALVFTFELVYALLATLAPDTFAYANYRWAIAVVCLLCLLYMFTPHFRHYYTHTCCAVLLIGGMAKTFVITTNGTLGLGIFLLLVFLFLRGRFLFALVICLYDLLFYNVLMAAEFKLLPAYQMVEIDFLQLVFLSLVAAGAYKYEYALRMKFLLQKDYEEEQFRTQDILDNMFPPHITRQVRARAGKNDIIATKENAVSILFCDLVDFTDLVSKHAPSFVVAVLDAVYSAYDLLCPKYGVQKMETVGKTYMAAAGLQDTSVDHQLAVAEMAAHIITIMERLQLKVKIGLNTGAVIAGVVGHARPQFSLFGDTVNTASRMCSFGEVGRVHMTEATGIALTKQYVLHQHQVQVKGKGLMTAYFLGERVTPMNAHVLRRSEDGDHPGTHSAAPGTLPITPKNHAMGQDQDGVDHMDQDLVRPVSRLGASSPAHGAAKNGAGHRDVHTMPGLSSDLALSIVTQPNNTDIPATSSSSYVLTLEERDKLNSLPSVALEVHPNMVPETVFPPPRAVLNGTAATGTAGNGINNGNSNLGGIDTMATASSSSRYPLVLAVTDRVVSNRVPPPSGRNGGTDGGSCVVRGNIGSVEAAAEIEVDVELGAANVILGTSMGLDAFSTTEMKIDMLKLEFTDDRVIEGMYVTQRMRAARQEQWWPVVVVIIFFAVESGFEHWMVAGLDVTSTTAMFTIRCVICALAITVLATSLLKQVSDGLFYRLQLAFFLLVLVATVLVPLFNSSSLVNHAFIQRTALSYLLVVTQFNNIGLNLRHAAYMTTTSMVIFLVVGFAWGTSGGDYSSMLQYEAVVFGGGLLILLSSYGKELYLRRGFVLIRSIRHEKNKADAFLYHMIPRPVADQLRAGRLGVADEYQDVTILYSDIKSFTDYSASSTPERVIKLLSQLFSAFDQLTVRHTVYKVQTIGDAYVLVSGLPFLGAGTPTEHAQRCVRMALGMLTEISRVRTAEGGRIAMRIGMHTGRIVAGCIGTKRLRYDIWGNDAIIANMLESNGVPGSILVSEYTAKNLNNAFPTTSFRTLEVKGAQHPIETFLIQGPSAS